MNGLCKKIYFVLFFAIGLVVQVDAMKKTTAMHKKAAPVIQEASPVAKTRQTVMKMNKAGSVLDELRLQSDRLLHASKIARNEGTTVLKIRNEIRAKIVDLMKQLKQLDQDSASILEKDVNIIKLVGRSDASQAAGEEAYNRLKLLIKDIKATAKSIKVEAQGARDIESASAENKAAVIAQAEQNIRLAKEEAEAAKEEVEESGYLNRLYTGAKRLVPFAGEASTLEKLYYGAVGAAVLATGYYLGVPQALMTGASKLYNMSYEDWKNLPAAVKEQITWENVSGAPRRAASATLGAVSAVPGKIYGAGEYGLESAKNWVGWGAEEAASTAAAMAKHQVGSALVGTGIAAGATVLAEVNKYLQANPEDAEGHEIQNKLVDVLKEKNLADQKARIAERGKKLADERAARVLKAAEAITEK